MKISPAEVLTASQKSKPDKKSLHLQKQTEATKTKYIRFVLSIDY